MTDSYPEDRDAGDYVHSAMQAAAGAVPVVGGLLSEVIEVTWTPTLQRRQADWINGLAGRLEQLRGHVSDLRERIETEEFLEVVMEAIQAARVSSEREKREALQNAVVNTALGVEPDQVWRLIFLSRLADLQPAHLHVLAFLDDPGQGLIDRGIEPPQFMAGSRSHLVDKAFPDWGRPFYDQLYADLDRASLVQGGLHVTMTGAGVYQSSLTDQGRRFLAFIREPATGEELD